MGYIYVLLLAWMVTELVRWFVPRTRSRSRLRTIVFGLGGGLLANLVGRLLGIGPFWFGVSVPVTLIGVVIFVLVMDLGLLRS
ncbi:MAG: hypothetical protein ACE5NP_02140 [Anaerolineae bacterium]